jgi:hypothetical protein
METRLTDQQVADLIAPGAFVPPSMAQALALEVQQTRARRCGSCGYFDTEGHGPDAGDCGLNGIARAATWSCADFTPKEPR